MASREILYRTHAFSALPWNHVDKHLANLKLRHSGRIASFNLAIISGVRASFCWRNSHLRPYCARDTTHVHCTSLENQEELGSRIEYLHVHFCWAWSMRTTWTKSATAFQLRSTIENGSLSVGYSVCKWWAIASVNFSYSFCNFWTIFRERGVTRRTGQWNKPMKQYIGCDTKGPANFLFSFQMFMYLFDIWSILDLKA